MAVVALNLWVGRALFAGDEEAFYFSALTAVAMQFGVYGFVRRRGQGRMFWVGFLVGGAIAAWSLCWTHRTGNHQKYSSFRWLVYNVWEGYGHFAEAVLKRMLGGFYTVQLSDDTLLIGVVTCFVIFLPQLVLALSTGRLCRLLGKWWGTRPVQGPDAPNDGPAASVPSRIE